MTDKNIAIRVRGLGKKYTIGGPQEKYLTMRDAIVNSVKAPFHRILHKNSDPTANEFWALKDVSFDVHKGEVVGIIGRNGAGKSTLLKILSRITTPSEGEVEIHGRVGSLLEVGTGFHPELTGRENIFLSGSILGMRKREIEEKFDEIVKFSEIEKFIDTPAKRYSSGMYVRLAFAVAAHLDTDILLVDEVLAVGDAQFQKKSLGKMKKVGETGKTVLLVSHNMAMINNICHRAILLENGHNILDNEARTVTQKYLSNLQCNHGESRWSDITTAPGNEVVRLYSISIFQNNNNFSLPDVDISKKIFIKITYKILVDGTIIMPGIWLKDKDETIVFTSANYPSMNLSKDPWYDKPHPIGYYQSVVTIPENFLNNGRYSVSVELFRGPHQMYLHLDHAVSFDVYDSGKMRKEYLYDSWFGTVRPILDWQTEYLGLQEEK